MVSVLENDKIQRKLDNELIQAILSEDSELIDKLIQNGANPNFVDENGKSVLFYACSTDNYELVEAIITEIDMIDIAYGCTALNATDNEEIIELLFQYGMSREIEYYDDFRYYANFEEVYHFDNEFRDDVIKKVIELNKNIAMMLVLNKEEINSSEVEFIEDLRVLGVTSLNLGKAIIDYSIERCDIYSLNTVFEKSGYLVSYEGSNNSLEGKTGIYFVE